MSEIKLTGYEYRNSTSRPEGVVRFVHNKENQYDPNAVEVYYKDDMIGYLKKGSDEQLFVVNKLKDGVIPKAIVKSYAFATLDENKKPSFNDNHEGILFSVVLELEGHTGYIRDGVEYLSITNLLSKFQIGDTSNLIKWAINKFKNEKEYEDYMVEAASGGTDKHDEIEKFLKGTGKGFEAIANFQKKFSAKLISSEEIIYSDFGIAARYDAIITTNGHDRIMVDWKSSKNLQLKHELQVAFNAVETGCDEAWVVLFGGETKQGFSVRKVQNLYKKYAIVKHLAGIFNLL